MKAYLDLLDDVLTNGTDKGDRTGTGTRSVFGRQFRIDLADGFPLLTTKRVFWRGVVAELLWFIAGDTNARTLQEQGVSIWNEWDRGDGELGPIYGKQWRRWTGHRAHGMGSMRHDVDQLAELTATLQTNPDSRRMVVSAWNVADLPEMALAPCHCLFQVNTRPMTLEQRSLASGRIFAEAPSHAELDQIGVPSRYLDLQLYQRSADIFLGVPFNIASYALLAHLLARHVGMVPGEFIHTFGDLHLYANHFEQAQVQLGREPTALPVLGFAEDAPTNMLDIRHEHLTLDGYEPQAAIKAPVAV